MKLNVVFDGAPFKVINERTGHLIEMHHTLKKAQEIADLLHHNMPGNDHFVVYEVRFCGGSKRLADREVAGKF